MENLITKTRASRSKNFTTGEINVLVEEAERKRDVLFGPLRGPGLTQFHRDRAWEQVLNAVNAVAPATRSVADLKKKFKDQKSRAKVKANTFKREARKTGGGDNDAVPMNDMEEKLLTFIGIESIQLITGGIDTFRKIVLNNPDMPLPSSTPEPALEPCSAPHHEPFPVPHREPRPEPVANKSLPSQSSSTKVELSTSTTPIPAEKKTRKRKLKTSALEEIQRTTQLQVETNHLLGLLVGEFVDFKQQFLLLKQRELDLMEENINLKKKKIH